MYAIRSYYAGDEAIAYVDQWGVVTGIGDGTTTITINSTDGNYIATAAVNVNEKATNIKKSSISDQSITVYPNPYDSGVITSYSIHYTKLYD